MRSLGTSLRLHWPEYLIEAWGLGTFMVLTGAVVTLLEYSGSPFHALLPDPQLRRVIVGLAVGVTLILLVYSPWGRQSGAHFNPAVTLAFFRLGKVAPWDAVCYSIAQLLGGIAGVLLIAFILGPRFTEPPVQYITTVPGAGGELAAFSIELAMTFVLMGMVLLVSNTPRLAWLTGLFSGCLVCVYIFVAGPISGMSLNPARTLSSALPAEQWIGFWIYLTAPPIGMVAAAEAYRRLLPTRPAQCAKLIHDPGKRCIHCGHEPGRELEPTSQLTRREKSHA
jgi:aquaporin Z